MYVQGAAGVKTKIEFPNLAGWQSQGPIAINKAELVIKADPTQASANLPINKQLYLVSLDSLGNQYLLLDMFENSVYYGGQVDTDNNEYKINMARYFQQLVDGEQGNYGLYLKELSAGKKGVARCSGAARLPRTRCTYIWCTRVSTKKRFREFIKNQNPGPGHPTQPFRPYFCVRI